jgi:23S rRNA maturation-related 3'-5' exoribonuclease YhaM
MLRGLTNPHLRAIAECFLIDEEFMQKFTRAPAGVKNHHAYLGGLIEHVVNLMEVVLRVAPLYPNGFAYTDEGQLIGHLVMAVGMLDKKVVQAQELTGEAIPASTVLRLKHMIVSHHGEYDFGSPKLPMTLDRHARRQALQLPAANERRPQRRERLDDVQPADRAQALQGERGIDCGFRIVDCGLQWARCEFSCKVNHETQPDEGEAA